MTAVNLFIDGDWCAGAEGERRSFFDPATGEETGTVAKAEAEDVDRAVASAARGFDVWRRWSAFDRARLLRRAAQALRDAADTIAPLITAEQGKPLHEARGEVMFAAEVTDWFGDEGQRAYGRIIPARDARVSAAALVEPAGVVAGLSPWNYPVGQAVRKIAIALAAGCPIVLKAPEETPASVAAMVECFASAGLPAGVLNLLFGDPPMISDRLIRHPEVRVISFTGSTVVGRRLAAVAGESLTRSVMELGGHAPALVFADADVGDACDTLARDKFHNAGQACISPTRLLVQDGVFAEFLARFAGHATRLKVGSGTEAGTDMGPLANARRRDAIDALIGDAVAQGATLVTGGIRPKGRGYFYPPTILSDVPVSARIMNEEPFGPVAIVNRFFDPDEAFAEANRLDYALAAYGFSYDSVTIRRLETGIRSGMVSINHNGLGVPEVPFGGVRDSGFGDEGGLEAMREMMVTRFVSTRHQGKDAWRLPFSARPGRTCRSRTSRSPNRRRTRCSSASPRPASATAI